MHHQNALLVAALAARHLQVSAARSHQLAPATRPGYEAGGDLATRSRMCIRQATTFNRRAQTARRIFNRRGQTTGTIHAVPFLIANFTASPRIHGSCRFDLLNAFIASATSHAFDFGTRRCGASVSLVRGHGIQQARSIAMRFSLVVVALAALLVASVALAKSTS